MRKCKGFIQYVSLHGLQYLLIRYNTEFPPARGKDRNDVTCYNHFQRSWGPARANFPRILFVYEKPSTVRVPDRSTKVPSYMYFNRMLVLDDTDRPLREFDAVPVTLSSQVEAFRLEAMVRMYPDIDLTDLRARMPRTVRIHRRGREVTLPLYARACFHSRQRRFRAENCMITWRPRQESARVKRYVDTLLTEECKRTNSTKHMRPLTRAEYAKILTVEKGMHPERSKNKNSSRNRTDLEPHLLEDTLPDDEGYAENDDKDCRNTAPQSLEETQTLQDALRSTFLEYEQWMGIKFKAPPNFYSEPYHVQWTALQCAIEDAWEDRGYDAGSCPKLFVRGRWEGSLGNWTSAKVYHKKNDE